MSYDFLKKKFWSDPPGPAQGGYFKEFWEFFVILGFKGLKMGQKRKVLSQITCIWVKYNIIIQKKIYQTPHTPPGGRKRANLREILTIFTFFCLNHTNTTSYVVWLSNNYGSK